MLESDISLAYPIKTTQLLHQALTAGLADEAQGNMSQAYCQDLVYVYVQYLTQLFYLPLIEFSRAYDGWCSQRLSAQEAINVMQEQQAKMLCIVDAYCRILATDHRYFIRDLFERFDTIGGTNANTKQRVLEKLGSPEFIGIRNYVYEVGEQVVRQKSIFCLVI